MSGSHPVRPRPAGPSPTGPTSGTPRKVPEPPAFRSHSLSIPGACVDCGTAVSAKYATPRCWGCGRVLCADCYWRHGLHPSDHQCVGCRGRGAPSLAISGARAGVGGVTDAPATPPV